MWFRHETGHGYTESTGVLSNHFAIQLVSLLLIESAVLTICFLSLRQLKTSDWLLFICFIQIHYCQSVLKSSIWLQNRWNFFLKILLTAKSKMYYIIDLLDSSKRLSQQFWDLKLRATKTLTDSNLTISITKLILY